MNEKINAIGEAMTEEKPSPAQENESPEYTKADAVFAVFAAVIAFCFVKFVIFSATGFITTGIYIVIISAAIIYLKRSGFEFSGFNRLLAAVLYIFSFVFSITANHLTKGLTALFLFGAGAYFVYSVAASKREVERFLPFALCKAVFEYPFSKFDRQGSIAVKSLSSSKAGSSVKLILLGLLLTVPLTVVVGALLISADDGLERMFSGIFEAVFRQDVRLIILQMLIAVPCSMYLFGMFYSNSHRSDLNTLDEQHCTRKLYDIRLISNLVMYTAVTPICILYVMFFISQAGYFLSAFGHSLPDGFTYADYARRGFFELFWVSLINLGVICFISIFSKKAGREKPFALRLYNTMISVFTLILIATAISKMVMYIDEYGLTPLRVYTSWFMVLLAVIFVLIIIKQFRFEMKIAKHISVAFTLLFALLCFSRPEALIAKYNIEMYEAGYLDELDVYMLEEMSDDGLLVAVKNNAVSAEDAQRRRKKHYQYESFGKYNVSSVMLEKRIQEELETENGMTGGGDGYETEETEKEEIRLADIE